MAGIENVVVVHAAGSLRGARRAVRERRGAELTADFAERVDQLKERLHAS